MGDDAGGNLPWIDDVGNEQGTIAARRVRATIKGHVTEERALTRFALEYGKSLMTYRGFLEDLGKLEKVLKRYA